MGEVVDSSFNTPSKITDFYPASPKSSKDTEHTVRDKEDKNTSLTIPVLEDAAFANSSVALTPKSSPVKDDITKPNDARGKQDSTDGATLTTHCKQVTTEAVTPSSTKKKRRRRKGRGNSASQQSGSGTSTPQPGPPKSGRKKKSEDKEQLKNTFVTDYFPVRRSGRRCQSEIEKEQQKILEDKILGQCEDGLKVVDFEGKGRGVVASKSFRMGEFVVEYAGDLIDIDKAKKREIMYAKDADKYGCYMYYFIHKNKHYCIDATIENGYLGRLLNHSRTSGNCHTKLVEVNGRPYLILVASRFIKTEEELLYDYGDRSKSSIESHPWLQC